MAKKAFEEIYQIYFYDVYLYLLKITCDEQLAEDLTSETFFKALKFLDTFRGDCKISTWLCQIAKNCYFSELRKKKDLPENEVDDIPDYQSSPDQRLIQKESAQEFREIIQTLETPYKEVFLLRTYNEMSFRQIGKIFKKTENWACVVHHRAKRKIQEKMEERNE